MFFLTNDEIECLESSVDVAENDGYDVSIEREAIRKIKEAAQHMPTGGRAEVCPECDSEIVVCMMGHYCGEKTPAAKA